MTLGPSDSDRRREIQRLRTALKALEAPDKAAAKKTRQRARLGRETAIGKTAPGQRQPRQRDNGYLAWLRRLPCVAGAIEGGCAGPIQAAHIRFSDASRRRTNPGTMRKPDDQDCVSLCEHHHLHDQHRGAERAFWSRLGLDPGEVAGALYAAYQAGRDGAAVITDLAQRLKENERSHEKHH